MAKLKDKKIEESDIIEYLDTYSDFSFEIRVLQKLKSLGFDCVHASTYEDPITKKTREFDIRAWKHINYYEGTTFRFCLAVECKNLRDNFPLVVHCLPRSENEAYQIIVWSQTSDNILPMFQYGQSIKIEGDKTIYKIGELVGKSCDQVGRKPSQNGQIIGSDSDVFDKISQSINSTYDIFHESHYAGDKENKVISFILPVLVVPNNRIWTVSYDNSGNIIEGPKINSRISYYVDKRWKIGGSPPEKFQSYYLSHLEIVQIDSLEELIEAHTENERFSLKNLTGYFLKTMEQS